MRKSGRVVCADIHMSDIPAFPYRLLWEKRRSPISREVTADEFFAIARMAGIRTETVPYPLGRANDALADLRMGRLQGAAVLVP